MKKLSPMRMKILEYVNAFTRDNGYPPTVREIGAAVDLRSPSTVHSHLKILQENGYLNKSEHKMRSIKLTSSAPSFSGVPLLGTVTAGAPILAYEELVKYIPFEGDPDAHFALAVRGDSMIDAAILDGDIAIVRRQNTAVNGQVVVAMLGDEATVKRLKIDKGHIWLMPENELYAPIDGTGCVIIGLVVAIYRPQV